MIERGLRTGWFYKRAAKGEMVLVMPVTIPCDSCGESWLNPGLALFDGMTQVMDRIAERLTDEPAEHPRRGLRQVA